MSPRRTSYDALPPYPPVYTPSASLPSSAPSPEHLEKVPLHDDHDGGDAAAAAAHSHQHAFELADDEEVDVGGYGRRSRAQTRRSRLILAALIVFAGLVGLLAASSWSSPLRPTAHVKKHLDLDLVLNGTFAVQRKEVAWVREAGDGWYSTVDKDRNIWLENVNASSAAGGGEDDGAEAERDAGLEDTTPLERQVADESQQRRLLVNASEIIDEHGNIVDWAEWKLSPDMEYLLLLSDKTPIWRHSSLSTPYLYRFADRSTRALLPAGARARFVGWASTGHALAWVRDNDLWVLDGAGLDASRKGRPVEGGVRITDDGAGGDVFNGVPDWVYEEEVFGQPSALWFSPSSSHLAFLKFNESAVPTFQYPVYDAAGKGEVQPYPEEHTISYPKPGFANPTVETFVFSLEHYFGSAGGKAAADVADCVKRVDWAGRQRADDQVLFDVAWVGNAGAGAAQELLLKESDRSAAVGSVVRVDVPTGRAWSTKGKGKDVLEGKVVRELSGGSGWIEHSQLTTPYLDGYIEVKQDDQGWRHLAYFDRAGSDAFAWLTTGEWEVDGGVLAVDEDRALAYFIAAAPSTERHVYSALIPAVTEAEGWEPVVAVLTETAVPGYFGASFSPGAGYWVESCEGPGVPWQRVRSAGEDGKVLRLLEDNAKLLALVADYLMPSVQLTTAVVDGVELNVKELRPPNMDETGKTKYPVLLAPYGGPTSQSVSQRFAVGFHEYLTTEAQYIVLVVDGRGTGFRGAAVRDPIRGKLGAFEARDQIEVAREWAGQRLYVDSKRVGIWGWSFGGYLTGKVLELGGQPGSEGIISLGMAVAPVTDWRFYDSIYTERYMRTPETNVEGYGLSGINNMTGFGKADFLLAHGSADDNVHYANTASLLEKLTMARVRRFESRLFVDSNHRVNTGGAFVELHEWMSKFLRDRWGKGGKKKGW